MPESERPRSAADYARLQEGYGGRFVAARNGEVVASAETSGELFRLLDESGDYTEDVVVEYVWPKGAIFAY